MLCRYFTIKHIRRLKMNIIELKDISKSFSGRKVLNQINLSIKKGDIVGLIGRNGSGKTVLMKCICGFLTPEQGRIKSVSYTHLDVYKRQVYRITTCSTVFCVISCIFFCSTYIIFRIIFIFCICIILF